MHLIPFYKKPHAKKALLVLLLPVALTSKCINAGSSTYRGVSGSQAEPEHIGPTEKETPDKLWRCTESAKEQAN